MSKCLPRGACPPTLGRTDQADDTARVQRPQVMLFARSGTHPRIRSDRTRDWTIRCRVVPGLPFYSRYAMVPQDSRCANDRQTLSRQVSHRRKSFVDTVLTKIAVETSSPKSGRRMLP